MATSTKTMGPAAQAAIVEALMFGTCREGELTITLPHRRSTIVELVDALTDVYAEEWEGETGTPYRSYRGRLPCGLRLDIITDREHVEPIEIQ